MNYAKAKGEPFPMMPLASDLYHREPMTFKIYADTGEKGGPFASLPLAFKHARALFLGNKKRSRRAPSCLLPCEGRLWPRSQIQPSTVTGMISVSSNEKGCGPKESPFGIGPQPVFSLV